MVIAKYVFSPWNSRFIKRRLSMKDHIDQREVDRGYGVHHAYSRKELKKQYKIALNRDDNRDFILH